MEHQKSLLQHKDDIFSEDFANRGRRCPLENYVIRAISHGSSPYQIIEQLVEQLNNISSELKEIKTNGIPPILISVTESQFKNLNEQE